MMMVSETHLHPFYIPTDESVCDKVTPKYRMAATLALFFYAQTVTGGLKLADTGLKPTIRPSGS